MSLLNDLDKTKMKNLYQGNNYKNTKNQYNKMYHDVFKYFFRKKVWRMQKIQEIPAKGDFIKYDFQFLSFNNGPMRGENDYTKVVVDIQEALLNSKRRR